jgi:Na+(H+)/acetate symporter ActP
VGDLTAVGAVLIGIPVGFVATVLGSLATRPPTPEQAALVDGLRRPDSAPLTDRATS